MASNPPGHCCTVGVKHEGEPTGTTTTFADDITVYIAEPARPKPGKAILYIADVIGIWENSKLLADQFAANGYYTIIPDLFNHDQLSINRPPNFDIFGWVNKGSTGDNPHTVPYIDAIVAKAIDFLHQKGYTQIGAVGYCFGAKYVVRFMSAEKGAPIKVGYGAHPSFVDEDELAAIQGPLSISAAQTDVIFPAAKRHRSEEILIETGLPWQINLFSGVEHGYAVRADLDNKWQRFAKERAFEQAVSWFEYHL